MGFWILHLLVPKERDLMGTPKDLGEDLIGVLHCDGIGEAPHPGVGAEVDNMAIVPLLPTHNLGAHHNKEAH